jgi:GH24 family phage-related lysozyme (muramidase)
MQDQAQAGVPERALPALFKERFSVLLKPMVPFGHHSLFKSIIKRKINERSSGGICHDIENLGNSTQQAGEP